LNVIVLAITIWRVAETNNIADKKSLKEEKQELRKDVKDLKISLENKKYISGGKEIILPVLIDDGIYDKAKEVLLNWLDEFENIIDAVKKSDISKFDKKNIVIEISGFYKLFKKHYDTVPPTILLNRGQLLKAKKEDVKKQMEKVIKKYVGKEDGKKQAELLFKPFLNSK
jgi:hypothetical protein